MSKNLFAIANVLSGKMSKGLGCIALAVALTLSLGSVVNADYQWGWASDTGHINLGDLLGFPNSDPLPHDPWGNTLAQAYAVTITIPDYTNKNDGVTSDPAKVLATIGTYHPELGWGQIGTIFGMPINGPIITSVLDGWDITLSKSSLPFFPENFAFDFFALQVEPQILAGGITNVKVNNQNTNFGALWSATSVIGGTVYLQGLYDNGAGENLGTIFNDLAFHADASFVGGKTLTLTFGSYTPYTDPGDNGNTGGGEEGGNGGGGNGGNVNVTPEPATMLIFGLGLVGLPLVRRFNRKK